MAQRILALIAMLAAAAFITPAAAPQERTAEEDTTYQEEEDITGEGLEAERRGELEGGLYDAGERVEAQEEGVTQRTGEDIEREETEVEAGGEETEVEAGGEEIEADVGGEEIETDVGGEEIETDVGGEEIETDVGDDRMPPGEAGAASLSASLVDPEKKAEKKEATIEASASGIEIVDPATVNEKPSPGQGHFHYRLDGGPIIATTSDKLSFHELSPGEHTISVVLAGNDHQPIGPEKELTVDIP